MSTTFYTHTHMHYFGDCIKPSYVESLFFTVTQAESTHSQSIAKRSGKFDYTTSLTPLISITIVNSALNMHDVPM